MYDSHGIDSEVKVHEGVRNDNAAGNAKFDAHFTYNDEHGYATRWKEGSIVERAYRREFGPTKDPDFFRTDEMLGSYDFYGSELKTEVLRELLDFAFYEFGQEKLGERDLLAEAVRKMHGGAPAGKDDTDDGGYQPFRSEVISKLLEDQLGLESQGCDICDLDDYQAMRIDWGYVGSLIQKDAAVRRLELRQERREAEKAVERRKYEEKIKRMILSDPYLTANARHMRFGPPMDHTDAMLYFRAGGEPELKGVVGVGGGVGGSVGIPGKFGISGSATLQLVADSEHNIGLALCGGTGLASGTGFLVGPQFSGIWGIDSICELNGTGISPSLGGGYASGFGFFGDIGLNGANLMLGYGAGGWGGTFNITSGCTILWSLQNCEREVAK